MLLAVPFSGAKMPGSFRENLIFFKNLRYILLKTPMWSIHSFIACLLAELVLTPRAPSNPEGSSSIGSLDNHHSLGDISPFVNSNHWFLEWFFDPHPSICIWLCHICRLYIYSNIQYIICDNIINIQFIMFLPLFSQSNFGSRFAPKPSFVFKDTHTQWLEASHTIKTQV